MELAGPWGTVSTLRSAPGSFRRRRVSHAPRRPPSRLGVPAAPQAPSRSLGCVTLRRRASPQQLPSAAQPTCVSLYLLTSSVYRTAASGRSGRAVRTRDTPNETVSAWRGAWRPETESRVRFGRLILDYFLSGMVLRMQRWYCDLSIDHSRPTGATSEVYTLASEGRRVIRVRAAVQSDVQLLLIRHATRGARRAPRVAQCTWARLAGKCGERERSAVARPRPDG